MIAFTLPACNSSQGSAGDAGADAGAGPPCLVDLPTSCPASVPGYKTDIAPILRQYCVYCHGPSGLAGYPETTYDEVYAQRSAILDQVYGCMMPPSGVPTMSAQDRVALLSWLVCNAPDN